MAPHPATVPVGRASSLSDAGSRAFRRHDGQVTPAAPEVGFLARGRVRELPPAPAVDDGVHPRAAVLLLPSEGLSRHRQVRHTIAASMPRIHGVHGRHRRGRWCCMWNCSRTAQHEGAEREQRANTEEGQEREPGHGLAQLTRSSSETETAP